MTNAAPGWYPDPAGSPRTRWWDGTQWTDHFYDPATGVPAADLTAPAGTKVYNVWIWLLVFLPYLTLPLAFTYDLSSVFADFDPYDPNSTTNMQLQLITSPTYIIATLLGWLINAAVIFFGFLDWRWLKRQGVPKPFHWAFSFIILAGFPVYPIGRAVITNRRAGKGIAVMWVTIALIVVSIIVVIAFTVTLMSSMMTLFQGLYTP